jgi:ribosome-binding factor A
MASTRLQRVARLLKEELSRIIRAEIDDPRLGMVSITDVDVAPDLRAAEIFVSVYGDADAQAASIAVLERASKYLRGVLGREIEMRYTPELHFHLDHSLERGARVLELLHEIEHQDTTKKDGTSNDQS